MKKHGETKTRLFRIWSKMNFRCSPKGRYYHLGRRVCDEWSNKNDKGYENFKEWALKNGYSDELSIDRINNDGNYEPDNCRWADQKTQCNNMSTNHRYKYKDEYKTLAEYSREYGISRDVLKARIQRYGWTVEKAIETPLLKRHHSYNGETHTIREWSEILNIPYGTIQSRMYYGYSFEDSIIGNIKSKERGVKACNTTSL